MGGRVVGEKRATGEVILVFQVQIDFSNCRLGAVVADYFEYGIELLGACCDLMASRSSSRCPSLQCH